MILRLGLQPQGSEPKWGQQEVVMRVKSPCSWEQEVWDDYSRATIRTQAAERGKVLVVVGWEIDSDSGLQPASDLSPDLWILTLYETPTKVSATSQSGTV